mmetsp:Transcript_22542/g.72556  ORF Transcript_22542/g.72556 Transcript_22542/m.72556 type:complete len:425 (+) Transcript_22542:3-1277(+)
MTSTTTPPGVLMIGTGEYTTGYVHGHASSSDKSKGVVALTLFDLRKQGKVGRMALCGTNGTKMPGIRTHLDSAIRQAYPASEFDVSLDTYPADDATDAHAYIVALDSLTPGDMVTIYTPDDTHFDIALAAVERGIHVLLTKPLVKTLAEHRRLFDAARARGVLVMCEVHKRWDPMYSDARDRIREELGPLSYMVSFMSQPKKQLRTFAAWAGRSSDISYYLNSHHIDFLEWAVGDRSHASQVTAMGAKGVAQRMLGVDTEDTITVNVQWANDDGSVGTSSHTSSWIAPPSDVHSKQRFFFMGQSGQVQVNQAQRGYTADTDDAGHKSVNPLYMRYTPKAGKFVGQQGYGYQAIAAFVDAVLDIRAGRRSPEDFDSELPTVANTFMTTAILEAGRLSLDNDGRPVKIVYAKDADGVERPTDLVVV